MDLHIFLFGVILLAAAELKAEPCFHTTQVSRLSIARYGSEAVYDGDDSIFIIAGVSDSAPIYGVLKYGLSSDKISAEGTFVNQVRTGTAQITASGEIFYLGFQEGLDSNTAGYRMTVDSPRPRRFGNLSTPHTFLSSAFDGDRYIYITGGVKNSGGGMEDVLRFDTLNIKVPSVPVGSHPYPSSGVSSVWFNGSAYMFNGYKQEELGYTREIRKFTPPIGDQPSTIEVLPQKTEARISSHATVTDGEYIYVIGGSTMADSPDNYLTRFNPVTGDIHHFDVDIGNAKYDVAAVYIPKTHRIYLIGGWDQPLITSRQIRYIQLSRDPNCTLP